MELGELLVGMISSWKDGTETGLGVPEAESVTRDEFFAGVRAAHLKSSSEGPPSMGLGSNATICFGQTSQPESGESALCSAVRTLIA